jgi:nicotinamide riboside kinase
MTVSVLLLGGECTGKTSLATAVAEDQRARGRSVLVVSEALRDFVDSTGRTPHRRQCDSLTAALDPARAGGVDLVVCDPAPLMTAVYSVQYFTDDSLLDHALAATESADLLVWCLPDLPWQPDGLHRDGPEARDATHELLASRVVPRLDEQLLHIAAGSLQQRVARVRPAIEMLLA